MRPANTSLVAVVALCATISACAASQAKPIVISGHTLDWAGDTFEAVDAGMRAAQPMLTAKQVADYEEFVSRWSAGYKSAAAQWKDARKRLNESDAQQAAGILSGLLRELTTWQFVMLGAHQ